jgi:mono/diheme cytochrome c family protein
MAGVKMSWRPVALPVALAMVAVLGACARPTEEAQMAPIDATRGRLLYENACIACHTTQAHWRDKSIVTDWPGLVGQVTRWQAIARQNWTEAEIRDVAAFLNQRFYRLPAPDRT